jgi:hypothetical protein
MGTAGFEPESEALEAPILARLNYVPELERWTINFFLKVSIRKLEESVDQVRKMRGEGFEFVNHSN